LQAAIILERRYDGAMVRILCALLLAAAPLFAAAQDAVPPEVAHAVPAEVAHAVPAEVAHAVREVVQAQLDAFLHDDAERAFELATPAIRKAFGSAENFLEMVRSSYAVVYRPKSVVFETPLLADGQVIQPVRLSDTEGRGWIAVYPMQRQPDGSWRTNGCQLRRLAGQET
jgi:hypothetical protein